LWHCRQDRVADSWLVQGGIRLRGGDSSRGFEEIVATQVRSGSNDARACDCIASELETFM